MANFLNLDWVQVLAFFTLLFFIIKLSNRSMFNSINEKLTNIDNNLKNHITETNQKIEKLSNRLDDLYKVIIDILKKN